MGVAGGLDKNQVSGVDWKMGYGDVDGCGFEICDKTTVDSRDDHKDHVSSVQQAAVCLYESGPQSQFSALT